MKQFLCLLSLVAYVTADIGITAAQNQYLPPKQQGYNYDRPSIPFGTAPQTVIPSRPIAPPSNSYLPPATAAPPPPPSNQYLPASNGGHHEDHHHHEPGMPFDFAYAVSDPATANEQSHKATSDGDVTRGEYRVALPDGRTQIVRYTADWKNGYNAEVTYEGEARYPPPQPSYPPVQQPSYPPAQQPSNQYLPASNNQNQGYIY